MVSLYFGYAVFLLFLSVFLGALATYAWDHGEHRGATPFAVMLVGQSIWAGCAAAALLTRGSGWALFWSRAWYVGVTITMASLLVFTLEYTGNEQYLGPRTYALLSVEPLALLGVAAFAPDLLYTIEGPSATQMLGFAIVERIAFWLHAAYSYLIVMVSSVLIIRFALTSNTVRRRQAAAFVVAVLIPWFGNAFYLFTDYGIDTTPLTFAVTGVALSYAVFRAGLLDISPIAHREVVESLSSGVLVVDTDGYLTEINDAGLELVGDQGAVGRPVDEVFDHWPALRDVLTDDVERTETRTELQYDGRHFEARVTPLYDDRGENLGLTALVHDITEQKARETKLQHRNRQLDQFASVVSHDLRNPLSVASGSLELAEQTGEEPHFSRVRRAHDRMSDLIDQVLTLARDEGDLETAPHSIADLARQAWVHVDTGEATLTVDTDDRLVCNEAQSLQLLENAFRNSVEHAGSDCHVTITTVREGVAPEPATDGVLIADDGPGIPPTQREAVFDHGMTTSKDGTGLGLAIIEKIARSHGWSIQALEGPDGGLGLLVSGVTLRTPDPTATEVTT